MAGALNALFDKRKLALTRARLRAWWDGQDFNREAALAEIEAKLIAANENLSGDADDELFDEPPFEPPPRLVALATLWGEGRIRPGDASAEAQAISALGLAPDGVLAVFGPGQIAPVVALAGAHPGKIEVFEWREEALEAVQYGVRKAKLDARVTVSRIDLEAHVFAPNAYDGLLSIDDFAYCGYPPHLAQRILKCLKPGAAALADCYVGFWAAEFATAFATSFAEPQIRPHGDLLQFFTDVGLQIESDDDIAEEFMGFAREGFKQLGGRLSEAKLDVAAARELAWEAEAWRVRLKLMAQRRLDRRRFLLRKANEAAAPSEAEAPPAETEEMRSKRSREDNWKAVADKVLKQSKKKK
jgi:hypothetical protein